MDIFQKFASERKRKDEFFAANPHIKERYCEKKYSFELSPVKYHKWFSHEEARLYCFSLNINGKVGWRVPEPDELMYMLEAKIYDPDTYAVSNSKTIVDPVWKTYDYKTGEYENDDIEVLLTTPSYGCEMNIDVFNAIDDIIVYSFKDGTVLKEQHEGYGLCIPIRDCVDKKDFIESEMIRFDNEITELKTRLDKTTNSKSIEFFKDKIASIELELDRLASEYDAEI